MYCEFKCQYNVFASLSVVFLSKLVLVDESTASRSDVDVQGEVLREFYLLTIA